MRHWIRIFLLLGLFVWMVPSAFTQVRFKLELMPDNTTYQVSLVSDTTWAFPYNLTSSAQVTIRAPHGEPPNQFVVGNLTALQAGSEWDANVYVTSPQEAPSWDYVSFGLVSLGTSAFAYETGLEVPLFSFQNNGDNCVDSVELIHPESDPFLPPNSEAVNIGHSIVTFGGGLGGSFSGIVGTGKVPCTPISNCNEPVTQNTTEICQGETLMGFTPQNDTLVKQHFISLNGCDSLVETYISVLSDHQLSEDVSICMGESYKGNAFFQDTSFFENYTSIAGCDSILQIHLSVLPNSFSNLDSTICHGETYQGINIFQDTTIFNVLVSANGCDSIVTSFIQINPIEEVTNDTSVCEGTVFGGVIFEEDGWIEESWQNAQGCDSLIIHTDVWVNAHSQAFFDEILLAGETWNGTPFFNDTTFVEVLENEAGCDSILNVNLNVFPPNAHLSDTIICEGQVLQGQAIYTDTLLIDTLPSLEIMVTDVNVIPTSVVYIDTTICAGSSFAGMALHSDTILTEVFNSFLICDSVVITQVSVLPEASSSQQVSVCFGEPFDGVIYDSDTILVETLQSATGCDSMVYTELFVMPEKTGNTTAFICEGEAYGGIFFPNDTLLFETLTAVDGCDSLLEINLTVHPKPTPQIFGENKFCEGETITLAAEVFEIHAWSTGENTPSILVADGGTYGLTVTDANGCQGDVFFETEMISLAADIQVHPLGCGNERDGSIVFENTSGGESPYLFSIDGGNTFGLEPNFTGLNLGEYDLVVQDFNACEWRAEANVGEQPELELALPENVFVDLGDSVRLAVQMNFDAYDTIIWSPSDGLGCTDCPELFAGPTETTEYTVTVVNSSGCEVKAKVAVHVAQRTKVYLPNAFSPNGDGINDRFYPFGGADVQEVKLFQVFDRYGALVFEQKDFQPNEESFGWEGEGYAPGTYVYLIIIEFINKEETLLKGEVHLIK